MGLIIDTNVFIDAERHRLVYKDLAVLGEYDEAYIAAITVSELLAGVHLAKTVDARIQRSAFVEGVLSAIPCLPFEETVARTYAELYAHVLRANPRIQRLPNVHDLQIAATAITNGFAILTNNVQDFRKVPGLKIETPR
jgi:predicted nucleic acid-binding protein